MAVRAEGVIDLAGIELIVVVMDLLTLLDVAGGIADNGVVLADGLTLFNVRGGALVACGDILKQRQILFLNVEALAQVVTRNDDVVLLFQADGKLIHCVFLLA